MSKDLTATYANIVAHSTPRRGEPQQDLAERASPTEQVSHTAQIIRDTEDPDQGNGQCPFEMASNPTGEQGQQRPPMSKSRGATTTKRHHGTTEPENAMLVEDMTLQHA